MLKSETIAIPASSVETTQQPKGLYLLFFTEMWERFGFYTLQTIIILYMTKALLMQDEQANLLYSASSAILYLSPIIGGYIADRYLGFQRSILIGGALFIIAYITCASPNKMLFFLGLSLLICANGFFKPNVSAIVGDLYQKNDPRREGGFTLFYMGINIGALIPPVIAGALVAKYGWHSGFLLAAVGMALGQLTFQLGRKKLEGKGYYPKQNVKNYKPSFKVYAGLFLGMLAFIGICQVAFIYPQTTNSLIELAGLVILAITLYLAMKEPRESRNLMIACIILIAISVGFWALYNQAFTSLMLFADRNMEHKIMGIPLDAESTAFFNSFFIIALSPILSRLWLRMDKSKLNPSIQNKFVLGILFMSLGYLVLAYGAHSFGNNGLTSPNWLVASYFLQTIGELLLSPIGLAMITVFCPQHRVGMMMGVWFFAQALSFAVGGFLANIAAVPDHITAAQSLPIYSHAFTVYGLIAMVLVFLSLAFIPYINYLTKHRNNAVA